MPAHDPETLARRIKAGAAAHGFGECRVARVDGAAAHAEQFDAWLAAGTYGDMKWMARAPHRRRDPRAVLPGVQSVVIVALNYYRTESSGAPDNGGARGRIARYAWGDDYHDVMDAKLRDLCAVMEEAGGTQRLYVDTGPVLERDWATAAGVGWNGKSTVQIHQSMGTWFFLGEILTTLSLTPDPPVSAHCGRCTRCMTACPTGAITAPNQLDARRCISYLTIEHKGPVPMEFRRAIGDRIYGCDDCLDVCPWNRFAQDSRETAFAARPYVQGWRLRDFLSLTDEAFRRLFRSSPIKRLKRPRFLRNVCVALGNVGNADDLPALKSAAAASDALIAEHARWAVGEIRERLAGQSICSALRDGPERPSESAHGSL